MTRLIERAFLALGIACLGYGAWSWLDASIYQFVEGRRLEAMLPGSTADGRRAGTEPRDARPGTDAKNLIGRITIERVGLSAIVAEGVDSRTLRRAVGHVPTTALPGARGNVVLAGHRDSFFRPLKDVQVGDQVTLTTPDGTFDYDIDSADIVGPERTDLMSPSIWPTLTLITCYPFNYVGPAPDRFVVRARPAEKNALGPAEPR